MLRTADLDYELPERLLAMRPVEPRDACRLMVVSRTDPSRVEHRVFRDLPSVLRAGDLLVTNTSRVIPARICGCRADTGAKIEGLFLSEPAPGVWSVLLKANTKLREGHLLALAGPGGAGGEASAHHLELLGREGDGWRVRVHSSVAGTGGVEAAPVILARIDATPLPPYIISARKASGETTPDGLDRGWYQTVYADRAGSVAAPTAGMHFTPELLGTLGAMGALRADVTLHVGIGTFKPIEVERVSEHPIHSEEIEVPASTIAAMESARARAGRVVGVGTTSVRAIESVACPAPPEIAANGVRTSTRLFIQPGHAFRWTDALITNFHLPRSTLLALVGAFLGGGDGGVERLLALYREAIERGYRFYSYGDAMLILP